MTYREQTEELEVTTSLENEFSRYSTQHVAHLLLIPHTVEPIDRPPDRHRQRGPDIAVSSTTQISELLLHSHCETSSLYSG